jgi:glycosyltransferase involved in cell wall biosynthesis
VSPTINIVVKPGWILERMARELAGALPGVTINAGGTDRAVDPGAALTYYMPAKDILKFPSPRPRSMGLFTHGPIGDLAGSFRACTSMNKRLGAELRKQGADVTVIRPGTWLPERAPIFGVVGRAYNSGRKGQELVAQAVAAGFNVLACAPAERIRATANSRWPCPVTHKTEARDDFYRGIDYLLVPALEEGGPMPVLEAIARHVPVIAPDVGWCWEFPVIRYERGSWESLRSVLDGLTHAPTWTDWVEKHRKLFTRLLGG